MNIIGTSGSVDYLRDTGTRRYWPGLARSPVVLSLTEQLNARIVQERSNYSLRGVRGMSFMMEIEEAQAAQRPPLEQLAAAYILVENAAHPSIDFCRRAHGVPESNEKVAKRLGVTVATVRGWREIGRRATGWNCR